MTPRFSTPVTAAQAGARLIRVPRDRYIPGYPSWIWRVVHGTCGQGNHHRGSTGGLSTTAAIRRRRPRSRCRCGRRTGPCGVVSMTGPSVTQPSLTPWSPSCGPTASTQRSTGGIETARLLTDALTACVWRYQCDGRGLPCQIDTEIGRVGGLIVELTVPPAIPRPCMRPRCRVRRHVGRRRHVDIATACCSICAAEGQVCPRRGGRGMACVARTSHSQLSP